MVSLSVGCTLEAAGFQAVFAGRVSQFPGLCKLYCLNTIAGVKMRASSSVVSIAGFGTDVYDSPWYALRNGTVGAWDISLLYCLSFGDKDLIVRQVWTSDYVIVDVITRYQIDMRFYPRGIVIAALTWFVSLGDSILQRYGLLPFHPEADRGRSDNDYHHL